MTLRDEKLRTFYGQFGPFNSQGSDNGGTVTATVTATDSQGMSSSLNTSFPLRPCVT
jgi:hypothetical protein